MWSACHPAGFRWLASVLHFACECLTHAQGRGRSDNESGAVAEPTNYLLHAINTCVVGLPISTSCFRNGPGPMGNASRALERCEDLVILDPGCDTQEVYLVATSQRVVYGIVRVRGSRD
jgi:hypothetical protein